ncbi:MAG: hypothetical protein ACREK6_12055 [Candidatus Rokuibacteriota bacterium]
MTLIELRLLFIIGLLLTAVLSYVIVVGAFAALRWLLHQRGARVAAATPSRAAAERRVQLGQTGWRLRS